MLPRITKVRYLGGYTLELTFTTGETGTVNFSEEAAAFKGVLDPLRDKSFFAQVKVDSESGTIIWPGDVDFDPDVLYSKATGALLPVFARSETSAH